MPATKTPKTTAAKTPAKKRTPAKKAAAQPQDGAIAAEVNQAVQHAEPGHPSTAANHQPAGADHNQQHRAQPKPSREEIARLAEQFWHERGRPHGSPEHDWLRAEQHLMSRAS